MASEREVIRAMLKARPDVQRKLHMMVEEGKLGAFRTPGPEERLTIVAATDHGGIAGSKQVKCGCGVGVWLSPSTQAMIKARGVAPMSIICTLCFVQIMKEQSEKKRPQ